LRRAYHIGDAGWAQSFGTLPLAYSCPIYKIAQGALEEVVKVASYNVHKFRGTDGIVSPARVIDVICELNADLVALQEIDCRFGQRGHRLEPETIEKKTGMRFLGQSDFPDRHGWHGNALLARGELKTYRRARLRLPGLEPRGAIVRWRAGRCRQGY
jgi:endonuclease/exonuclease/phosphatase family metal-dependent hydrolase